MQSHALSRPLLAAAAALMFAGSFLFAGQAAAQAAKNAEYTPQVGQPGKDVVWVPTPEELVQRMLAMAQLNSNDVHWDLGSGDGRIAIAASKRAAKATGVEFNPDMVALSRRNNQRDGGKAEFINGDIFVTDFSSATVVTLYLLPQLNLRLRPILLDMKPGTRVVSHQFTMDDWEPDETTEVDWRRAMLWIVPAKVGGSWKVDAGAGANYSITLTQKYQKIEGTAQLGNLKAGLREARLRGDQIWFTLVDAQGVKREFAGKVSGSRIEGTARLDNGSEVRFTATKG